MQTDFPDHAAYVFVAIENIDPLAAALSDGPPFDIPSGRLDRETPAETPPCFLCGTRITDTGIRISGGEKRSALWTCTDCRSDLAKELENASEGTAKLLGDSL